MSSLEEEVWTEQVSPDLRATEVREVGTPTPLSVGMATHSSSEPTVRASSAPPFRLGTDPLFAKGRCRAGLLVSGRSGLELRLFRESRVGNCKRYNFFI